MATKREAFIEALTKLCKEHKVYLAASRYDTIQVWDLKPEGEPELYELYADFEDRTA